MAFGKQPAVVYAGEYGRLACPACGDGNLHQTNTTIFERSEDEAITTVIAQDGDKALVSKFPSHDTCNPSPRRHGMLIEFDCEQCGSEYTHRLAIFQHKGHTYLEWVE